MEKLYQLVLLTVLSSIILYIYYSKNENRADIERFYFKNDKMKYYIMRLANMILLFAIFLNIRYFIYKIYQKIFN